jgi:hypothetical protein
MKYGMIEVEVSEETAVALAELASRCNHCSAIGDGFASHGASFDVATLLALLAEDAGKIINEPESWQSANMRQVLAGHGYLVGRRVQ